jgi:hypothetical protein
MMTPHLTLALRRHSFHVLLGACAAGLSLPALAQTAVAAAVASAATDMAAPAPAADDNAPMATVEISSRKTRSSVALSKNEIQKILPGTNPLKALQTLPGVSFQTADPWGNNEQNLSLFVHGFSGQQLGYTMDGVPLGDQQYGNYNGLSPQRAVISENVRSVVLSSGAGDLATASTSNLGGTIETYSSDPLAAQGASVQQTVGSHRTSRTFARYDTGAFGDGSSAYFSILHHEARAWDFDARQGGDQFNAKYVNRSDAGKLTLFFNYSDKIEPNEDSTVHWRAKRARRTRPLPVSGLQGGPQLPVADGRHAGRGRQQLPQLLQRCAAHGLPGLRQVRRQPGEGTTWSNQVYYHNDDGAGVVAGPIGVAGLPGLFSVYYPKQNLKQVFGNSGYAVRTTEYDINRGGWLSTLRKEIGDHQLEAGLWLEHNRSSAYRRWYALDVNNPRRRMTAPAIR